MKPVWIKSGALSSFSCFLSRYLSSFRRSRQNHFPPPLLDRCCCARQPPHLSDLEASRSISLAGALPLFDCYRNNSTVDKETSSFRPAATSPRLVLRFPSTTMGKYLRPRSSCHYRCRLTPSLNSSSIFLLFRSTTSTGHVDLARVPSAGSHHRGFDAGK